MIRTRSTDVGKHIGLTEDVIILYNKIISIYLNPANTQQTKTVILTAIIKIEENITEAESLLLNVLNSNATRNARIATLVFLPSRKAYIVYDLIASQLRSKRFIIISNQDLESHSIKILNANPRWQQICAMYGAPTYNPIPPGGGAGGGGGRPGETSGSGDPPGDDGAVLISPMRRLRDDAVNAAECPAAKRSNTNAES